jgi:hypothetical protein
MSVYNKFNRGEVDDNAVARDDVKKVNNSAKLMTNFLPLRLGPMIYRPGTEYLAETAAASYFIPFIKSITDIAALEFSSSLLRIWVNDALITRTAVTSAVTNGTFDANITSWTDASGAGSTTAWKTGGYLSLTGAATTSAVSYQTITTQTGAEHGLRIVVVQAPVVLKLGTSGASSEDIYSGTLLPGTHSLAFTPAANVTITFVNSAEYETLIDSVAFEGAGILTLPTSVTTLSTLRYAQSADIVYCANDGIQQFQVERRGTKSWSIVTFRVDDGPFKVINLTDVTLTAAALSGDTTLTASEAYFSSSYIGCLFKLSSSGQTVTASVSAADNGTNSVRVTGVDTARKFLVSVSNIFVATVTLQRSTDDASWEDVESYTGYVLKTYDDTLDNSILYYRLHVKAGDYTSGTVDLSIVYSGGSINGTCRVTGYTSATVVNIQVLTAFGSTDATGDWYEGQWSGVSGYPSAVALYEGRLHFAGKTNFWSSVSDAYTSFDRDILGDSKSIYKTIGFGPVDSVYWMASSNRLIMGVATDEVSVRTNSFGEVLTATNANLKSGSTQGSAQIAPVKIDDKIYFVQRSGIKVYELEYDIGADNHKARDLMTLNETICNAGIKRIFVSRQPETRIFIILDDGTARVYLTDPAEDVYAFSRIETDGTIEDGFVLPGTGEDRVYFVVNRTGGRYLEKFYLISEATNKHLDSAVSYASPGTTLTGLDHLEGKTVHVWADNQYRESAVVDSGQITVSASWTTVIAGLRHTADYTSNKLGQYVPYSVLNRKARVSRIGMIARDLWPKAIQYGPSFTDLQDMPDTEYGTDLDAATLINEYDTDPFEFDGSYNTDNRIYLRATGPCTILALTYDIKESKSKAAKEG